MDNAVRTALSLNNELSLREIARREGVPRSSLQARLAGRPTRLEGHVGQQLLSEEEENAMRDTLSRLAVQGWAPSVGMVRHMAVTLVQARAEDSPREVGKNWAPRFLKRHPELARAWSASVDSRHAAAGDQLQDEAEKTEGVERRLQRVRQLHAERLLKLQEGGILKKRKRLPAGRLVVLPVKVYRREDKWHIYKP